MDAVIVVIGLLVILGIIGYFIYFITNESEQQYMNEVCCTTKLSDKAVDLTKSNIELEPEKE